MVALVEAIPLVVEIRPPKPAAHLTSSVATWHTKRAFLMIRGLLTLHITPVKMIAQSI